MSLLSDLKDRLGGWRKDATAKQVSKLREGHAKPVAAIEIEKVVEQPHGFAKGGTVEELEHGEGKAGPGTRGAGDPTERDEAEYEGKDAVDNDFPGPSDDDESDIEVEKAVEKDSDEPAEESFEALLKRLQRG